MKNLSFKVNTNLEEIVQNMRDNVRMLRKDVNFVGENKFLCCGSE